MKFNLSQLLISASFVLDFIEKDILKDVTNHGKRVGYIALKIGEQYNLTKNEKYDLLIFALLHDIGAVENLKNLTKAELEKAVEHCEIGEDIIKHFPFTRKYKNIIKYHHENYDGSGFFKIKENDIPLFSQIISIADFFELHYKHRRSQNIIERIKSQVNLKFSEDLVKRFLNIVKYDGFWLDIQDDFILSTLQNLAPVKQKSYAYEEVHAITSMFSKIIDSKSEFTRYHTCGLSEKVEIMCEYYGFDEVKTQKMIIASDLHDIGKLGISNDILDKRGKLTTEEFETVKEHVYYTRKVLEPINGFKEITEWAANHHERNDGSGYPFGLTKNEMDFESRLMAALDVYQALTENRPYRKPMSHEQAVRILKDMAENNKLDTSLVNDIDDVFEDRELRFEIN